jgi:sugar lactone lactonase YvrE
MMRSRHVVIAVALSLAACGGEKAKIAPAAGPSGTRLLVTVGGDGSQIEGLAAWKGQLYVADWKDGAIYRVDPLAPVPAAQPVGRLGTKPGQTILGVISDADGNLYAAIPDPGVVLRVTQARLGASDFDPAKDVSVYATGVAGANGLTFGGGGVLWVTGGDHHALYTVPAGGGAAQVFAKDYTAISTDTTMPVRGYTVNGVALDKAGRVYTANTGTGEITRFVVKPDGTAGEKTVFAHDPLLIGADGMVMDDQDRLWVSCNYRNALVRIDPSGALTELAASGPDGPLHFPAELKLVGGVTYLSNLNFPVGANSGTSDHRASIAVVAP